MRQVGLRAVSSKVVVAGIATLRQRLRNRRSTIQKKVLTKFAGGIAVLRRRSSPRRLQSFCHRPYRATKVFPISRLSGRCWAPVLSQKTVEIYPPLGSTVSSWDSVQGLDHLPTNPAGYSPRKPKILHRECSTPCPLKQLFRALFWKYCEDAVRIRTEAFPKLRLVP
jgi:hypothetical protein